MWNGCHQDSGVGQQMDSHLLQDLHAAIMMMEKQEPSFNATYVETCVLTVIDFCIYIAVLTYTRDRSARKKRRQSRWTCMKGVVVPNSSG
jgi:hypothetical protein